MKTPQFHKLRSQGFTLIELLVVISIIAILAGVAVPVLNRALTQGRFAATVSNAKQIGLALRQYASAHDGQFPLYKDPDSAATMLANSNDAFQTLVPRYCSDKTIFFTASSKWCRKQPGTTSEQYLLRPGDNDWAYVRGLTDTSDSRLPLAATAFAPGTRAYVKDKSKPGGVWSGEMAAVLRVDGGVTSAQDLRDDGQTTFVKRPDAPTRNMFEKDGAWLDGDDIEVLMPIGS